MGVPADHIAAVLNGKQSLTDDMALRLSHYFGASPEMWPDLQELYEQRRASTRRLGCMSSTVATPEDFDILGADTIAAMFDGHHDKAS